ncbi:hypothetical protein ABPG74_021570 [Tetrahymena malaccensis]
MFKKDLTQKQRENNMIAQKQNKVNLSYEQLEQDHQNLKQTLFGETQRRKKIEAEFKVLKEQHEILNEKSSKLEKKVEILSLKNLSHSKDQVLRLQGDMVKENEQLQKNLQETKIELARFKDMNQKLLQKIDILYKKIEFIKMNKTGQQSKFVRKETLLYNEEKISQILQENKIPESSSFRYTASGNPKFTNILNEIIHSQPEFVQFIQELDEYKKDIFTNLGKQFLADMKFVNQINSILNKWVQINQGIEIQEFQLSISQEFKEIFMAENVHMWLYNQNQDEFMTLNYNKEEIRLVARDQNSVFNQCIQQRKNIIKVSRKNSERKELNSLFLGEIFTKDPERMIKYSTNQVILCPLVIGQNEVFGIVEISNIYSDNFDIDLQICAIIFSQLVQSKMISLGKYMIKNNYYRFKDYYSDLYKELLKCRDELSFQTFLSNYVTEKLNIDKFKIFYISQANPQQFYGFDSFGNKQAFQLQNTTLQEIVENKKCKIIFNPYNHQYFNNQIDLETQFPVLYIPMSLKEQSGERICGVLQFIVRQNYQQKMENFSQIFCLDSQHICDSDTIDQERAYLAQIISEAYQNVYFLMQQYNKQSEIVNIK